jgi:hypothetical protein
MLVNKYKRIWRFTIMAKIVKIKEVYLYIGLTDSIADSYAAKKLLDEKGIKYGLLSYNDPSQHKSVFDSLNTWTWGDIKLNAQREFKDFPILHWKAFYDDYEQQVHNAVGLEEIKKSDLLKYAKLIEA